MPSLPDVMAPFPPPVASRFDAGFRCQDQHLLIGIVPAWQAELVLWHWQVQPQLGNRSEPRFGHLTFHRQWIRPSIWPPASLECKLSPCPQVTARGGPGWPVAVRQDTA